MTSNDKTEYSNAILSNYTPKQAANVIRSRLDGAELLNEAIADWLRERAFIEDRYSKELEKLASTNLHLGNKKFSEQVLGTFGQPWTDVVKAVRSNAQASNSFSQKLRNDIEKSIRQYCSNSAAWAEAGQLTHGLDNLANQVEDSQNHLNSVKSSKREAALTESTQLQSQWESQATYSFGQFEKLDESRWVFLKDVLTRFETLEADRAQNAEKQSEKVLNSILTFEPIEDMRSFSARVISGDLKTGNSSGGPRLASHASTVIHSPRGGRFDSRISEDSSSLYSATTSGTGDFKSKRESVSGLHLRSKVGSILRGGRKKKESNASRAAPILEDESSSRNSFVPRPNSTRRDDLPRGRLTTTPATRKDESNNEIGGLNDRPAPPPSRKSTFPIHENGTTGSTTTKSTKEESGRAYSISPTDNRGSSMSSTEKRLPSTENRLPSAENRLPSAENRLPSTDDRSTSSPLKVNIREDSLAEEPHSNDDDVALSTLATTLRSRATISRRNNRGRRDIQSKLFTNIEPSDNDSTGALLSQLQTLSTKSNVEDNISPTSGTGPSAASIARSSVTTNRAMSPTFTGASVSDVHSVRSIKSTSTTTTPARHPEVPQVPGLTGTVIEAISATLKDGVIHNPTVKGEVAVAYNGGPIDSNYVYLRFVNASLEQVVPNPQFVTAVSHEKFSTGTSTPGTMIFKVDLQNIYNVRQGIIALRYAGPYGGVPVVFTPIWRIEPNQSSLMLTYKLSDEVSSVIDHIILQDVVITVPVQGGRAISAQSKPVSVFNKEAQRITWKLKDPLTVTKDKEGRMLCRFATEGGPVTESVNGIDVKFKIYPAPTFLLEYKQVLKDDSPQHEEANLNMTQNWLPMNSLGTLTTGKYTAHADANIQKRLE